MLQLPLKKTNMTTYFEILTVGFVDTAFWTPLRLGLPFPNYDDILRLKVCLGPN